MWNGKRVIFIGVAVLLGLCLLCSFCGHVASAAPAGGGVIYPGYDNSSYFDGVSSLLSTLAPAVVLMLGFALGAWLLSKAREMF